MRAVLKTLPDPHQLLPQPSLHDPVAASATIVPFEYPALSFICLLRKLSISTPLPVSPPRLSLFTLKIATVYYYYYYYH